MTYVYWLHLPSHTDITTEGYIGVSNRPKRRLWEHYYKSQNPHLTHALNKYKDIVHTILLEGPEDYCYEIEAKLRPTPKLGWNINQGGSKPPSWKGRKNPQAKALLSSTKNPMYDPLLKIKQAESRARDWMVTSPQGQTVSIHNLSKFCRENRLYQSNMINVANGKIPHSQGWKCVRKAA